MQSIWKILAGVCLGVSLTMVGGQLNLWDVKHAQPYAGQDQRNISSLSAKDIDDLSNGRGWGLAKPAELNGYPGPAHVLELDAELALEPNQRASIQKSFDTMQSDAKALGIKLIEAEAAVDEMFRSGDADAASLAMKLDAAAQIRAKLRAVHLSAHLEITPLLDETQKIKYAELRGYAGGHASHSGH